MVRSCSLAEAWGVAASSSSVSRTWSGLGLGLGLGLGMGLGLGPQGFTPPPCCMQVDATEWHYMDSTNTQQGPVTTSQLRELYEDGTLYASTYVWCEEMDSWKELKQAPITL